MGEEILACLHNRKKEGASIGRYKEIGLILVQPSSCGPELAALQPSVSAAAPGAGLQRKKNVRQLFTKLFLFPSLSGVEN